MRLSNKKVLTFLFLTGFISILGQIVLLRELNIAFRGIELIYTLSFGAWLLGTSLGVFLGKKNFAPSQNKIYSLFLCTGMLFPAELFFIRNLHVLFGGVTGAYLPFGKQIISMFIALLPVSVATGILFKWVAKLFISNGNTLAGAYSVESFGGLFGGAASTLLIISGLQNFDITLICSMICFTTFILNLDENGFRKIASLILTIIVIIFLYYHKVLDNWITSEGYGRKVESIDTPYNRITISNNNNQASFFDDNALSYETESFEAEEFVQLAYIQSQNPVSVLVLGGGFKGIVEQLIKLPISKIDYVEYNKKMFQFIKDNLPGNLRSPLNSDKVNIIFEDPRQYLGKKIRYNMILLGMPEPGSGLNNRYYTKEFYEKIIDCLKTKGIFAFKLPSSENFWTPALKNRNASIYKSLKIVFNNIIVLPGTSNIFIASNDSLIQDPAILSERLLSDRISNKLVTPQYVNYIYKNDRYNQISDMLNDRNVVMNTDIKPICYQYSLTIWLSKFFPGIEQLESAISTLIHSLLFKILLGLLLFITILAGRKWNLFRRSFMVFIAGFQGMVLEIILLLNYQIHNGILYQNIGVLIMGFMLGLASGAWIVNKVIRNYLGFLLILFSMIIYLFMGLLLNSGYINAFLITFIALIISGFITSGLFGFAGRFHVEDQNKIISPLYASDLLGGVLGSVIANIIFIPLLGFGITAQLMIFPSLLLLFFL